MTRVLDSESIAAKLVADPRKRRYLEPFLGRERRLSEAARELDVSPQRLAYWIKRFLEVGLLVRTSRGYRSLASAYFVPFSASRAVDFKAWLTRELEDSYQALLTQYEKLFEKKRNPGLLVFRNPLGQVQAAVAEGPEDQVPLWPYGATGVLYLSEEEQHALKAALRVFWQTYGTKVEPGPGRRRVLVFAFLAEMP